MHIHPDNNLRVDPRWTSSDKSGCGTSVSARSPLWFTLSHGIVNEVYYPRLDQANIRDLGLIVTDGKDFFSEEKRDARHVISPTSPGVPAYEMASECFEGRYRIRKTVFSDPRRPCLIQKIRFDALVGGVNDYRLYALLAPHLGNRGAGNDGWFGDYKGIPMFFAQRDGTTLAFACSIPWVAGACAFVGENDGWQDLKKHRVMTNFSKEARGGNLALTGEIDLAVESVLVLAFGANEAEAGERARASLIDPADDLLTNYEAGWKKYQSRCDELGVEGTDYYRISTAVLRTHQSKHFVGGMTASLSIPWGFNKGDNDLGGYHLVWPRDQVESAGALLACGDTCGALDVLRYLLATQEEDGHWAQNMWLDGTAYWHGIQLDETAFPILLADALKRGGTLGGVDAWPAVRKAAAFIVKNGPMTLQDRWEEDGGYSPFTLAVVIAGLLAAADFADAAGAVTEAAYLRETADLWNASIEDWTYVTGTPLAQESGVDGYYVRIAPLGGAEHSRAMVPIKNRPVEDSELPVSQLVSPDALALVRFGLRAADDPRILSTVKIVDHVLKCETATGPGWHRYNDDGYGEHEDGSPFDGTGIGRAWPLLCGERAHYELAAGNFNEADRLRKTMEAQSGPGRFFPEQVWDAADIPELELFSGKPSGSAMPLVWTHAEYIKLLRSLKDGKVFDMPPQTVERYQTLRIGSNFKVWRFNDMPETIPEGKILRIELLAAASVRWTSDDWNTTFDVPTHDTGLGIHVADLNLESIPFGSEVYFTFYWNESAHWEGRNLAISIS